MQSVYDGKTLKVKDLLSHINALVEKNGEDFLEREASITMTDACGEEYQVAAVKGTTDDNIGELTIFAKYECTL